MSPVVAVTARFDPVLVAAPIEMLVVKSTSRASMPATPPTAEALPIRAFAAVIATSSRADTLVSMADCEALNAASSPASVVPTVIEPLRASTAAVAPAVSVVTLTSLKASIVASAVPPSVPFPAIAVPILTAPAALTSRTPVNPWTVVPTTLPLLVPSATAPAMPASEMIDPNWIPFGKPATELSTAAKAAPRLAWMLVTSTCADRRAGERMFA